MKFTDITESKLKYSWIIRCFVKSSTCMCKIACFKIMKYTNKDIYGTMHANMGKTRLSELAACLIARSTFILLIINM